MGCCENRGSAMEQVLDDFWKSLPIKDKQIEDLVKSIVGSIGDGKSLGETFESILNEYFFPRKEDMTDKKEKIIRDHYINLQEKPEVFYWGLLFLCKENEKAFIDQSPILYKALKGEEETSKVFVGDKLNKDKLLEVLREYTNFVTLHGVDDLAKENNISEEDVDYIKKAFNKKKQEKFILNTMNKDYETVLEGVTLIHTTRWVAQYYAEYIDSDIKYLHTTDKALSELVGDDEDETKPEEKKEGEVKEESKPEEKKEEQAKDQPKNEDKREDGAKDETKQDDKKESEAKPEEKKQEEPKQEDKKEESKPEEKKDEPKEEPKKEESKPEEKKDEAKEEPKPEEPKSDDKKGDEPVSDEKK